MHTDHFFFRNDGADIIPVIHQFHTVKSLKCSCKILSGSIALQIPFHTCNIKLCFHPLPILSYTSQVLAYSVFKDNPKAVLFFCLFLCLQQFPDQTVFRHRLFQIALPQLFSGQFHLRMQILRG